MGATNRPMPAPPVSIAGLPVLDRVESPGGAAAAGPGGEAIGGSGRAAGADPGPPSPVLRLSFEARSRSRQRARLVDGAEVALVLPRGGVLRHGAVLTGAGLRVRIEAADEDLLEVRCATPRALARAAYHLGNRHVAVQIDSDRLLLGYDAVLADMLVGMGARIQRLWSPFEPEAGAYGGHAH